MEQKKTPKADLENKRTLFLEIGLAFALVVLLVAFEWKSYDKVKKVETQTNNQEVIEEHAIATQDATPPPPPPPPPAQPTDFEEVDNDTEITNEIEINAEDDQNKANDEYKAPPPPVVEEIEVKEEVIFDTWEEKPEYPGGDEEMLKFLNKTIKYPDMARQTGLEGTVYVEFVVERDGSITRSKVIKGIGGGCDEEALAAVNKMPKWTPGKQRGKAVRISFRIPVKFVLAD